MIALVVIAIFVAVGGFVVIRQLFGKTGLVIASVLGLGLFALLFVGVSFKSTSVTQITPIELSGSAITHSPIESSQTPEMAPQPESEIPTGPTPSKIQYITGHSAPIEIQELPGWRKNPPHEGTLGGGHAKYVLTSQQFATLDEAEAELFQSLTVDVHHALSASIPPIVDWVPTVEDLRVSGLIAEKVIETLPLKIGEHDTSVQRVSWLVEFKPETNQALLARWQPIESQRRSKLILAILAGVSGVFGVSAMALRRSRNPAVPRPPENQLA